MSIFGNMGTLVAVPEKKAASDQEIKVRSDLSKGQGRC